jgi:chaperonin cofactor prefoldin
MEAPQITRQYGFNYSEDFIYEQVMNELEQVMDEFEEVNLDEEIVYRSVPVLTKSKSEEHITNYIKVKRSYSY